ncbi:MAG: response regulator [Solirubrobacterales bacterium]
MSGLSALTILVVDDEPSIRNNLASYLEDEGYRVISAGSGEEALDQARSDRIDLGIIDMRLPGIDGNTVIEELHHIDPSIQFLIHTGSVNYEIPSHLSGIGLSPHDVIRKPLFDFEVLISAIDRKIGDRRHG